MHRFAGSTLMLLFLLLACAGKPVDPPRSEATVARAPEAKATTPDPVHTPPAPPAAAVVAKSPAPKSTAAEVAAPKPEVAPIPTPPLDTAPKPVPPSPAAAPTAPPPPVIPAGPMPSLASNGHAALGPDKCKMCHRLQYDSWLTTGHSKKGLTCESCHGNGADYRSIAIMRNLAAAKAAGLTFPGLDFCQKCHGPKTDASFLIRAHAHKVK